MSRRSKEVSAGGAPKEDATPFDVSGDTSGASEAVAEALTWLRENPDASPEQVREHLQAIPHDIRKGLQQLSSDALARTDIAKHAEVIFDDYRGEPLVSRPVDVAIQHHFDQCRADNMYGGLLAPVGIGKSVQLSLVRVSWEICKNQNVLIKLIAATDDESVKRVVQVGRIIMHNPRFKRVWGHAVKPATAERRSEQEWSKHKLHVARTSGSVEPTVEGYGVSASAQGSRSNLLLFDDCVDARVALESPALKRMVEDKIKNQWLTRVVLHDHYAFWIVTRWTEDDPSGSLMRNPRWRFLELGVSENLDRIECRIKVLDRTVEQWDLPLPPAWNPQFLEDTKLAMGEIAFNRAYRQIPYSKQDRWFSNFEGCIRNDMSISDVSQLVRSKGWPVYVGVDISSKKRPGNAIVSLALAPDGRRYLCDARVGAWSSPELAQQLNEVDALLKPVVIIVEDNATQESFLDWARTARNAFSYWPKLQAFTTTRQSKQNPITGIRSMDVEFANNAWIVPGRDVIEHDNLGSQHQQRCGVCRSVKELMWYPLWETKDLAMATWFARGALTEANVHDADVVRRLARDLPVDPFWTQPAINLPGYEDDQIDELLGRLY